MMKKLIILSCLLPFCAQAMVCDYQTRQQINKDKKAPYQIYENIQKLFIPVLNANMKNYYYFTEAWKSWDAYTDCAHELITNSEFKEDKDILVFAKYRIKDTVEKINGVPDQTRLRKMLKELADIYSNALQVINEEVDTPLDWESAVLAQSAEDIFPHYKISLLLPYEELKKKSAFDNKKILDFVKNLERIASGEDEQQAINNFADKIDKLIYRLEADKKRTWYSKRELQKEINDLEEIFDALNERYIIETSLMREKISLSTDLDALIILSETKNLITIGQKVKNFLDSRK